MLTVTSCFLLECFHVSLFLMFHSPGIASSVPFFTRFRSVFCKLHLAIGTKNFQPPKTSSLLVREKHCIAADTRFLSCRGRKSCKSADLPQDPCAKQWPKCSICLHWQQSGQVLVQHGTHSYAWPSLPFQFPNSHLTAQSSDSAMAACWGHLSAACPRLPANIPDFSPSLVSMECHISETWLLDLAHPIGRKEIWDMVADYEAKLQSEVPFVA